MSELIYLIKKEFVHDEIGQEVAKETKKEVFATLQSISSNEFFSAGQNGLKAELKAVIFFYDYAGEKSVEVDGNRYSIYRTYRTDDYLELYLEAEL